MREAAGLALRRVTKSFGAVRAVADVDLTVRPGEFVCVLGPSGCGKSTLLRLIAGLDTPDSGRITLDGEDLTGLPPEARPLNMMFQSYALFPHLSVARNIGYGLKRAGIAKAERERRVAELLALLRLGGLERRFPAQLSGGQAQRVALARALARGPRLLLLDEPLGALDRRLREEMQAELKALQTTLGTAFVTVTHDQDEAMRLADRIIVMDNGAVVQEGTPRDVYRRPASRFVAAFLGDVNWLDGEVVQTGGGYCSFRSPLAAHPLRIACDGAGGRGGRRLLAVRPEAVEIGRGVADDGTALAGTMVGLSFSGPLATLRVCLEDGRIWLVVRTAHDVPDVREGEAVRLGVPAGAASLVDPD